MWLVVLSCLEVEVVACGWFVDCEGRRRGADSFAARVQVASRSLQELNVSGWTLRSEATAALCKLLTVLRWHMPLCRDTAGVCARVSVGSAAEICASCEPWSANCRTSLQLLS